MKTGLVFITSIIIILLNQIQCAKILTIFPMPAKSHYILGSALARGLAGKGHDVTMVSPFGEKNPPMNYHDVVMKTMRETLDTEKMNMFDMADVNPILNMFFMNMMGNMLTEMTLNDTDVQNLLKSNQKFDVVIIEQFCNDALKIFAHHFKAPMILFVTFGSNSWINPLIGNPAPPSYIPELMIQFSHRSFIDRVKNVILNAATQLNDNFLFYPAQNKILKKYFPDGPDLSEMLYNASLVLLNSHWSTNKAVPRVPSMIDIGGYHVQPPKKLPGDLQEFLDNSKQGVIYFSMGSNLRSSKMAVEKREAILKAFSKLKQNVLWKWEDDVLPGQPPNVKLGKWLPQQDILAHPNVKLFITHGGLLSLIESVYHGVPILAIPIFGDQKINAEEAVSNGMGLLIPFDQVSESKLTEALNKLLSNKKYGIDMKRRSKVMHDRQTKPMDDADYWVQYVIRHHGAPHLRNDGLDLKFYQYICLDVIAFLALCSFLVLYVLIKVLKFLCCRAKSKDTKLKKN